MKRIYVFITAFLSVATILYSDTIHVPADYTTIQEAIDASVNGDLVMVAPGIYAENIIFKGKAITVKSERGPDLTVIDGGKSSDPDIGSVVMFQNEEDTDSVISGFTITNGVGSKYSTDLIVGGGIWVGKYASPRIEHCIITGNILDTNFYAEGAGIVCDHNSYPTIVNNIISHNKIFAKDHFLTAGGGVILGYACEAVFANNIVVGNEVHGVYSESIDDRNLPNVFSGTPTDRNRRANTSFGGGVLYGGEADVIMTNCTIIRNSARLGGGLFGTAGPDALTMYNTILWDNKATLGKEIYLESYATLAVDYTDLHWTTSSVYTEPGAIINWGTHMIVSDPLFADAAGNDFHLTYQSPCRAAGNSSAVTELLDFEGDPRIAHGTVDLGADEFYTHLYITGNKTPNGDIQGKLVGLPGTTPVGLFMSTAVLPSPMSTIWGEFHLQAPWIMFYLYSMPSNGILALKTTLPGNIPAPYDVPMQALIGLNPDSLTNLYVLPVR